MGKGNRHYTDELVHFGRISEDVWYHRLGLMIKSICQKNEVLQMSLLQISFLAVLLNPLETL